MLYTLLDGRKRHWSAQKSQCEYYGAEMATVHSKEINDFLVQHVMKDEPVFIGGYYPPGGGGFIWTSLRHVKNRLRIMESGLGLELLTYYVISYHRVHNI